MGRLYATPNEIKQAMPDGIRSTTTAYDDLIYQLSERVSRYIDMHCGRAFYPWTDTRYYDGTGDVELWIDDLVSLTSMSYSKDHGQNYTAYTSADYILTVAGDYNQARSYNKVLANVSSGAAISYFPSGQRSIKVVGEFGYCENRTYAWEDSQDDVESNPLSSSATSCTVNDADGDDKWGMVPRFQVGQTLKIESEMCEVSGVNETTNTLTIVRGMNGSTAAAHAQNTDIYIWRPPGPVKQACVIQSIRMLERGFQGFGDARAAPDIGQVFYLKDLDPEAAALLQRYVNMWS